MIKPTFNAIFAGVAFCTSAGVGIDSISAYSSIYTGIRIATIDI